MDTLMEYLQHAVRTYWEELALTDFNGASYQYRDIARKTAKLHILYKHAGIKPRTQHNGPSDSYPPLPTVP